MISGTGRLLSLAAALCVVFGDARADNQDTDVAGGSFISGLTFRLIDLDQNDGITPTYWLDTQNGMPAGYTNALARTGLGAASVVDSRLDSTTNFLAQGLVTSNQGGVTSSGYVGSSGIGSVGAATQAGASFASAVRSVTQPLPGGYPYTLRITPNTQLVVTAFATTFATVGTGCDTHPSGLCGSVRTEAIMSGRVVSNGVIIDAPTSAIYSNAGLGEYVTFGVDDLPLFRTGLDAINYGRSNFASGLLSLTFTNASAYEASEHLQLDTLVVAQAVPEPGTYALMLAGLGAIGFVSRRRRR